VQRFSGCLRPVVPVPCAPKMTRSISVSGEQSPPFDRIELDHPGHKAIRFAAGSRLAVSLSSQPFRRGRWKGSGGSSSALGAGDSGIGGIDARTGGVQPRLAELTEARAAAAVASAVASVVCDEKPALPTFARR